MRKEKLEELDKLIEKNKIIEIKNERKNQSQFLSVSCADYVLNNGQTINRDRLQKNGIDGTSCNVLPVTKDGEVILVVQPRVHIAKTVGVEVPAGLVEEGENPDEAVRRELKEETGFEAGEIKKLYQCYQDEGCSKAIVNGYIAFDCKKVENQNLDKDEFIDIFTCTFEEALELIDLGYIAGAFSLITLQMSKKFLEEKK